MQIRTERQAWLYLAERCEAAARPPDYWSIEVAGSLSGQLHDQNYAGLCGAISAMPTKLYLAMSKRMRRNVEGGGTGGYWWPRNAEGAKQREAFCRKMAELCLAEE